MTIINKTIEPTESMMTTEKYKVKTPRKSLGLYLHIPFCVRKCNYCDFMSFGDVTPKDQGAYFEALRKELQLHAKVYGNTYIVDSIFLGGGTPSLPEESLISELIAAVYDSFSISDAAEVTIESNPGTLTKRKLNAYLASGINRLSMGVQSFDDRLLTYIGRIHTAGDALNNYELARSCGFWNINLDLMFAIPGQTMDIWRHTLDQTFRLEPEHISFYGLQLEEGTPFFKMLKEGDLKAADDDTDRDMYHYAVKVLAQNGYNHYEISNAAKIGFESRHNLKYWSMNDYLGIGLGAHSFMEGTRFSNLSNLKSYLEAAAADGSCDNPFIEWTHENSKEDNISEYLFTGMRKCSGIGLADFREQFGIELFELYGEALKKHGEQGLVEIRKGFLRFTAKGMDISNMVLAEFV